MNIQRPLLPKFLRKADDHLLLHKPEIWSNRTHLVVYYGLLFMAALALAAYIVPDDPRRESGSGFWVGAVVIISIIGLTVWLMYLLRFNVFKRYGIIKPADRLLTFILLFIGAFTIVLFPFVPTYIESVRAKQAYGSEEIVQDINAINTKICELEYDSLKHTWTVDSLKVTAGKETYPSPYMDTVAVATTETVAVDKPGTILVDTSQLNNRLADADSSVKIHDSLYLVYRCPNYVFLTAYNSDTYTKEKELNSAGIYRKVIKNYTAPDKPVVAKELQALIAKYDINQYPDYYNSREMNQAYMDRIREKYQINDVSSSIRHILERKYQWAPHNLDVLLRIMYYTTLIITLLIFIFRHSTVKSFFLALLTAVLISIFTGLLIAFSGSSEISFLFWLMFYFVLFFVISLFAWKTKSRHTVIGIAIHLFVFLVAFMPMVAVAYYYAILRRTAYANSNYDEALTASADTHIFYAETGGLILLLLLLATYIQAVYRQWYALPEE